VHDKFNVIPQLVGDFLRYGLHEIGGENPHSVEHTSVPQAIVAQRSVGKLINHDQVAVGCFRKMFNNVVPDETTTTSNDDFFPGDDIARNRL